MLSLLDEQDGQSCSIQGDDESLYDFKKKKIYCVCFLGFTFCVCVFQVKTTNPKKYCVRPNTGVVLPRSTCEVLGPFSDSLSMH